VCENTNHQEGLVFFSELHSNGNVALGKSATSSRTFNDHLPYGPELAVDGVLDNGGRTEGAWCLIAMDEAFLQLDLGQEYRIIFIRLFIRADCCGSILSLYIFVLCWNLYINACCFWIMITLTK
jgi:hypothetical protein